MRSCGGYAVRMRPEYRHLPAVMRELGWRTGRPTDTGLPRVFFTDFEGTRWEVKRSPQNLWRLRRKLPDLYVGHYVFPHWEWWHAAPMFDNPVSLCLWFDRVGRTLLKLRRKDNASHTRKGTYRPW